MMMPIFVLLLASRVAVALVTVALIAVALIAEPALAETPSESKPATAQPAGNPTVPADTEERSLDQFEAALSAAPDDLRLGAEYRQAVIAAVEYDRALEFFEALVEKHPDAANLRMNYGYAHVDKIPAAGAITQVILANEGLTEFSAALEISENWVRLYTRGNSYLYWPPIFGRTEQGLTDLNKAIELAKSIDSKPYHAHAWAALGDGHWRLGDTGKAREMWQQGLKLYPGSSRIEARLSRQGEALDAFLEHHFATGTRVETHLRELSQ